jgi:hypothetical protein
MVIAQARCNHNRRSTAARPNGTKNGTGAAILNRDGVSCFSGFNVTSIVPPPGRDLQA